MIRRSCAFALVLAAAPLVALTGSLDARADESSPAAAAPSEAPAAAASATNPEVPASAAAAAVEAPSPGESSAVVPPPAANPTPVPSPGETPGIVPPGPYACAPPPPPAGYAYYLLPAGSALVAPQAAVPVLGPDELEYEAGQGIPQGYRVEPRARRGLVIAGSVTAGVPFVVSFLTGLSFGLSGSRRDGEAFWPLMLPLVGPFVTMGTSESKGAGTLWLALDGIGQVGGTAMLIAGLVAKTPKLVRGPATVSLLPSVDIGPGRASATWQF